MLNCNVSRSKIWQNSWDKVGGKPFASFHGANAVSNVFKVHHSHPNTDLRRVNIYFLYPYPSTFLILLPVSMTQYIILLSSLFL